MIRSASGAVVTPNAAGDSDPGLDRLRPERTGLSMALIVAKAGHRMEGVRSSVGAAFGGTDVEETCELPIALRMAAERPAALVVLAMESLGADPEDGVAAMAAAAPDAAIVVVGDMKPIQEEAILFAGAQDVISESEWARSGVTSMASALRKAVLRQEAVSELRRDSLRDPLTGLFNRRGLAKASDALVGLADRSGASLLMLLWDVDGMKAINDMHGHSVGDHTLQRVASAIRKALRASDVVGRIGGDEFSAVAYGARLDDGECIHARVTGALDGPCEGAAPVISVSGGWAELDARAAQPLAEAMERADSMLYSRKRKDTSDCERRV